MNETRHIPATKNESWGFWGTMNEQANAAWPLAVGAVSDATGQSLESVRIFLDGRHGRHLSSISYKPPTAWPTRSTPRPRGGWAGRSDA